MHDETCDLKKKKKWFAETLTGKMLAINVQTVEKLGWRAWIVHTKLYERSDYLSTFCSESFGHVKSQQHRKFNITKNTGSLYNKDKTNIELSSIYLGI